MAEEIIQQKTCSKCGETKILSGFGKDPRYQFGVKGRCKICAVGYTREWRQAKATPVPEIVAIEGEEWRALPNTGLSVSNCGRVRRDVPIFRKRAGRLLKPYVTPLGYHQVFVQARNNKLVFVHRLVAEVFLDPDPTRPYVNHKNGQTGDNRPENLEWCTHAENMEHARRVLHKSGERKLNEQQVYELRQRFKGKIDSLKPKDFRAIAAEYGMERQAIQKAICGETWKHVE